jgi:hypothetical protein
MKTLLLVLAVAGLSGCAVYPAAPYESYESSTPYVVTPPLYIQGNLVYRHDVYPRAYPYVYPRGYYRAHPGFVPHYPQRPRIHGPSPRPRDRDGDGVPNKFDRRPHDWRRR